jgi:hypothetical protein
VQEEEEEAVIVFRRRTLTIIVSFAFAVMLLPAFAGADTRTFTNTQNLGPSGSNASSGPAKQYPSSIVVSGVPGTVTKVTVTLVDLASASGDDIDMAMRGPNGQTVMLMSDACGESPNDLAGEDWTFDDAAPTFLSDNGPCTHSQTASFMPSNYLPPPGTEVDDMNVAPLGAPNAPAPPYLNKLSFLAGGSPNGSWALFVRDDNATGFVGFSIPAWTLTLEVQPPATQSNNPPAPSPSTPAKKKKCKKKKGKAAVAKKCKKKKKKK